MAYFGFTNKLVNGETIKIFNYGNCKRDFTYIDDIVEGIIRIADVVPKAQDSWTPELGSPANSSAPYRVYNIGNGHPVKLLDFIEALETSLGLVAEKNMLPMQPGDVHATWADTEDFFAATGYQPKVGVSEGVAKFVEWYNSYYC